jgi:hypothetical protein
VPDYNLQDKTTVGILDVQFSPLSTPLVAWYVWIEEDDSEQIEKRPVLGVLLRHKINPGGDITGSRAEMAVQFEDTAEVCAANDSALLGSNEAFVGIYPASADEPTQSIRDTASRLRREMKRQEKSG